MSALNDYRLLWNAAFRQRQPSRLLPLTFALAGALSFIGAWAAYVREDWLLGLRVGVAVSVIVLQLLLTVHLGPGFELMNTPANARLVPRMRRRMVELTVGGWLAAGLAPLLLPLWQAAPAVALYMIVISLVRSGNRIAPFFIVVGSMSAMILKRLPPDVLAFLMSLPGVVCGFAVVVLFGGWAIRAILPAGGDRHFGERKQRAEMIARFESGGRKQVDAAPKRMHSLYGFALRYAIRSRQPRGLMLHVLGPSATVLVMLPAWVVMVVLGVGAHLLMRWYGLIDQGVSLPPMGWVFFITITVAVQFGLFTQWRTLMKGARNEQALLRLAACTPAADEWNRKLGQALACQVVLNALFGVATICTLGLLTGLDPAGMVLAISLVSSLVMPGIAFVLLDYSREQFPWALPRLLIGVAGGAVVVALHIALQSAIGPLSWVLLAVCSNAIGAYVASRRWRKMLAAPVAFPAGRFA